MRRDGSLVAEFPLGLELRSMRGAEPALLGMAGRRREGQRKAANRTPMARYQDRTPQHG